METVKGVFAQDRYIFGGELTCCMRAKNGAQVADTVLDPPACLAR